MNYLHTFVVLAYKKSPFLEECIQSVIGQNGKSHVVIATSTPNEYINNLAGKYNLEVIVNNGKKGIGNDFNFAISAGNSKLITIAHQDDIYENTYSEKVISAYLRQSDSSIFFTDYYELRDGKKVYDNLNLKIKKKLLILLRNHKISKSRFVKRSALRFGNAICCPSVTFNKDKCPIDIFTSNMKSNVDWIAWERLSNMDGRFYYIHEPLMGHRIYKESTTSQVIGENLRTHEDYEVLRRFWPKPVAAMIASVYSNSEKSNN